MSSAQYQRVLVVAEALLSKIDLPEETFNKYNQIKSHILSEPVHNNEDALLDQLRSDIVGLYDTFVKTSFLFVQALQKGGISDQQPHSAGKLTGYSSTATNSATALADFVDLFNKKRDKLTSTTKLALADCSIDKRIPLQGILDQLDEMEVNFDRYVSELQSLDTNIRQQLEEHITHLETIQTLRDQLEEQATLIKENEIIAKELKIVKASKDELTETLRARENELNKFKREMEVIETNVTPKMEALEQANRQATRITQEYERAFDRVTSYFRSLAPFNSTQVFNSRNIPRILDYIEDTTESILADNRTLHRRVVEMKGVTEKFLGPGLQDIRQLIEESNNCLSDMDNHAKNLSIIRQSVTSSVKGTDNHSASLSSSSSVQNMGSTHGGEHQQPTRKVRPPSGTSSTSSKQLRTAELPRGHKQK